MDNKQIEHIVSKYMKIWIWSIFFGANSTLTYALSSTFIRDQWGILSIGIAAIGGYAILFTFLSWSYLIKFFTNSIIPALFKKQEVEFSDSELTVHSSYLIKAFRFMVYASMLIICSKIFEIILDVFSKKI